MYIQCTSTYMYIHVHVHVHTCVCACVIQAHKNYMGRDPKVGPVLFSMVKDEDYRGTNVRLILRSAQHLPSLQNMCTCTVHTCVYVHVHAQYISIQFIYVHLHVQWFQVVNLKCFLCACIYICTCTFIKMAK